MVAVEPCNGMRFRYTHGGQIGRYDVSKYPFSEEVSRILGAELTRLHEANTYERLAVGTDQKTEWHRRFYAAYEADIKPLFYRFVREQVRPLYGEPVVFQRVPTFRVHLPGNVGVGEFHEDGKYNHPDGELNFLLPLTDALETATVWIESEVGRRDYRPANMRLGELFAFDGRNLRHGNLPNETGQTRVSFDFRVVPQSRYQPAEAATINTGMRFALGEYYDLCE